MGLQILRKFEIFLILIGILILARVITFGFFNPFNLSIILTMSAILGFLALGETLVILTRGIDLSVGNIASMSTVIITATMLFLHESLPPGMVILLAVLFALGGGALIGLVSGIAVNKMKIPPFIATMGTMWIAWGIAYFILRGVPTGLKISSFKTLGRIRFSFLPLPFIILLGAIIIMSIILRKTRFGVHIYAIGGNPYAAYLSGIEVKKVSVVVYILSGVFAAAGGLFLAAWTGTGFPRSAEGYELLAIAATVIGGVSLFGGRGSVWGPLGGVIILQVLDKIIVYRGISPFLSQMFIGAVLLIAIYLTTRQKGVS